MVAAGVGTVIAATIARLALTRARTQPDLVLLLVPAIPALLLRAAMDNRRVDARMPNDPNGWRKLGAATARGWKGMKQVVLGPLPARAGYALTTFALLGWVADCTDVPAWSRLDRGWWQRGRRPHDAGRHRHRIPHADLVRRMTTVRSVVPRLRQLVHDSTSGNGQIPSKRFVEVKKSDDSVRLLNDPFASGYRKTTGREFGSDERGQRHLCCRSRIDHGSPQIARYGRVPSRLQHLVRYWEAFVLGCSANPISQLNTSRARAGVHRPL